MQAMAMWESERITVEAQAEGLLMTVILENAFRKIIESSTTKVPAHVAMHSQWWGEHLEHLASDYSFYRQTGENIFHFNQGLIEMLKHTDVDEITFDCLSFPFEAFYLHFETGLPLTESLLVDGAYIRSVDSNDPNPLQALFISFTTVRSDGDYGRRWDTLDFVLNDSSHSYVLTFENGETVGEALKLALEDQTAAKGVDHEFLEDWLRVARPLIQLTLNCLFYLSYEKREVECRYSSDAPEKLVQMASNATLSKERQRSESKLYSLGFRKVHFCGGMASHNSPDGHGGDVIPHWRRGHWRNQPYGSSNSLRKLLWIQPTIVRPDKGYPIPKRLYELPEG